MRYAGSPRSMRHEASSAPTHDELTTHKAQHKVTGPFLAAGILGTETKEDKKKAAPGSMTNHLTHLVFFSGDN